MDFIRALGLSQTTIDDNNIQQQHQLRIHHQLEQPKQSTMTQCPVDMRIQSFLADYLADLELPQIPTLPTNTFILDQHGLARQLSIPADGDHFFSDIVSSYRVKQGVLHNPVSDRRTTEGSFHIVEGGLPIPGDKKAVSKSVFAILLQHAINPPDSLRLLPFTANQAQPEKTIVSLLLRPTICPEIPSTSAEKTMEIRFFAPGNLVSNLDFVESIFGNGGNPYLPEYDAALDTEHWSGHTGCVILAPHLTQLTKQQLGLPHWDDATERQRHDGMCWQQADERYNNGKAFKVVARDERGVIVTLLADNYYGYCKKEVKTQISYAANLYGLAEEEHAGGALAFPRRNHGEEYGASSTTREPNYTFEDILQRYASIMDLQPEGYGIDKQYPEVIYLQQDIRMDLNAQTISWKNKTGQHNIRLQPKKIYMQPNGYKIEMVKHPDAPSWRLVGTNPEGTFCHKPCTVSGGGKSEISKSLDDAVIYAPLFIDDLDKDLSRVQEIFDKDYATRFKPEVKHDDTDPTRKVLNPLRSLGSVIKLLTPSANCTDEFNAWLDEIPPRILALVFLIKRFYRPEWGDQWAEHLSVDIIDGAPGHELKLYDRRIIASYLRVGFDHESKWRTFKVRQDFIAAEKVQMEDDITASVVVPTSCIDACRARHDHNNSIKLVKNCEYRLFQRPDDAIHPGFDKQTELEMAQTGNFFANFEPLAEKGLASIVEDVLTLQYFTPPMRQRLEQAYQDKSGYVVSSAHPRLVDGKFSKNPRYLQTRPDLVNPVRKYVAEMGARFHRKLDLNDVICHPVDAVLSGRRNNPPEPGIRPLAVYNPIHYQQLPELFMDFICSLTGKSPSTTGAGSEGALTKGPFNALRVIPDLNNALVSFILTDYAGFSSSAGYIGVNMRVDHDISLLIPEIWARLSAEERQPQYLIGKNYLERLEDFEYEGQTVLASRLGYRINGRFVHAFMGKIFDHPKAVFTEEILRPETQDLSIFVDGINNIVEAQQKVAQQLIDDGSVEDACPPLKALLHIMATGTYQGMGIQQPEFRQLFDRDYLLQSDWYQQRLKIKQQRDIQLWQRHVTTLTNLDDESPLSKQHLENTQKTLTEVSSATYLRKLVGTIGADPLGLTL